MTPAHVDEYRSEWDTLMDYFYPPLLGVSVVFISLAKEDKSVLIPGDE